MITTILEWIVGFILKYLLGKAEKAAGNAAADYARDKEREQINEKNVKAYEEAVDRAAKIRAATDLVNRSVT